MGSGTIQRSNRGVAAGRDAIRVPDLIVTTIFVGQRAEAFIDAYSEDGQLPKSLARKLSYLRFFWAGESWLIPASRCARSSHSAL